MAWRIQSGVADLFEHISGLNTNSLSVRFHYSFRSLPFSSNIGLEQFKRGKKMNNIGLVDIK